LVGRLPAAGPGSEDLDRLLGSVLRAWDDSFNTILRLGFASSIRKERAVVAGVFERKPPHGTDPFSELRALCEAAGAIVVGELLQILQRPVASSYMGRGKLQELAELVHDEKAMVVVFENDLSPAQIRNIEQAVSCKVLDRSELILDIFASRARTHEARLQVELAQLEYTYPRLRAMWDHLERIVGGTPAGIGTRGPGEQQLEIDRRIVQRRKADLRREIRHVQSRKKREVSRRNEDFFTVGLVGYTNAGKSTLFNKLTGADVYADDRLFATLDTRTRRLELGGGQAVMLSDTVGFVRDLPHHLVASFRATLEESIHADLLLLVLDVTDPEAAEHHRTVERVLDEIGATDQPRLLLLNKIDRLEDNARQLIWLQKHPDALPISAVTGEGLEAVREAIAEHHRGVSRRLRLRLPISAGREMGILERQAEVHGRAYETDHAEYDVTIGRRLLEELRSMNHEVEVVGGT
ncbi:MAG: GTPase HflX, partial [Phycisphaeraceae bacterium]|nr:GTPase HflX [Phycisphaeraceae bacterium]